MSSAMRLGSFAAALFGLLATAAFAEPPSGDPQPESVTIAGSFQSELGCPGDWQPECADTQLQFDLEDGIWQRVFTIPAGNWEYKAPLNGSWDLNFGAYAQRNNPNIGLSLPETKAVKFYYSNATHWVTDNQNSIIAVVPGSFQSELGCNGDWDPARLRAWLQDPDGDGIFSFSARLPAGEYEVKVALNETWDVNFGAGGVQNGPNIPFSVPESGHPGGAEVFFFYDAARHILTVAHGDVKGDLRRSRAHWLDAETLAWNPASFPVGARVRLHADPDAGLALTPEGVSGGLAFDLVEAPAGLPPALRAKYPYLAGLRVFTLPELSDADRRALLKSQLALSAAAADGAPLDATGVQIPGALDALFVYDGALGPTFEGGGVALRVWAPTAQSVELLHRSDWVRIGLAGTLADFEFVDSGGVLRRADEIDYFGQRAGYTADPQESINFAASHDNETLFDAVQLKAALTATLEERIRLHRIGVSLVALGQGVPFFHAGQEMLRSKSMDRDSFNSGDWFNALDYSFQSNNWGRGLPAAEKNRDAWPLMAPLLADPTLKLEPADLAATVMHFEQTLRIRASSPLFRLRTAEQVRAALGFLNTGPSQIPGLIAMSLSDPGGSIDRRHARIVTLFNAGAGSVWFPLADWQGQPFVLHPVRAGAGDALTRSSSFDPVTGEFFVPARTTAVFVSPRPAAQRIELLIADVQRLREAGTVNAGVARSLSAKLETALRHTAAASRPAAANALYAFILEAAALGSLEALRREAAEIRTVLLAG